MNPEDKASLQAAVFANTARNPQWLGFWLARHQQTEELDEQQLTDKLGIAMDNLVQTCLCRTPRDAQFQQDLQAICQRTGASAAVLAQLLRQEQAILRMSQAGVAPGTLMAASDRPPEPPKTEPEDAP